MDSFEVDKKFDSFEAVLLAKRSYEEASNTVLVIRGSHLMKGDGDFVKTNVYDRIIFKCKAGEERKPRSKGIRKTSTYKMNCPFTVNISLPKDKLTVTHVNLNHENHQTNRATFLSYPENVRLTESEVKLVSPMIACGSSKQQVKAFISKGREAPVPLKLLHNLDSKMKQQKQGDNRKEDLKRLIDMMMQVPNGRVRIITNEENEFIGVYFQDERMATIFENYPEIIFFDATHKLNNADMPLFIQLCVDGNGDSEIISLYLCVSESREGVGSMIDEFQKLNPSHIKTKVILGDKDFADRLVYLEKFVNAVLKICLFHVLRTFLRKITSHKRGITNAQRESALEVLQRLVYSTSDEEYNAIYNELLELKLEKVEDYYNTNWHNIRDRGTVLKSYHNLLTPFSFQKVEVQYVLAANVKFLSFDGNEAVVDNKNNDKVSETGCSCLFFSSMQLPCRHILRFFIMNEMNPFEPELCATRWTMEFYKDSHPALSSHVQVASTTPVYTQVRDPNLVDRFKKNDAITKEIRNIATNLPSNEQNYFIDKLKDLRNEMYNSSSKPIRVSDECVENPSNFCAEEEANMVDQFQETALDLSINRHSTPDNVSTNPQLQMATDKKSTTVTHETYSIDRQSTMAANSTNYQPITATNHTSSMDKRSATATSATSSKNQPSTVTTFIDSQFNKENISTSSQRSDTQPELSVFSKSQPFSISSSINNIDVPQTVKSVGRPKGRVNTAIGTKRKKRNDVAQSVKKINEDECHKRFVDKSQTEQTFTIIKWLTLNDFSGHKKITFEEIVNDANVFQRLRNDEVFLGHLKQFCDCSSYEYIKNEVCKLHEKPWICSKCSLNLDGEQVQCDMCLDWFHLKCVLMPSSKKHFICSSC